MKGFGERSFAYWIGLVQSDGSFKRKLQRRKKTYVIEFEVKDRILVESFQKISADFLDRNAKIFNRPKKDTWTCGIGVTRLLKVFDLLCIDFKDPPKPPLWVKENPKLFGAYLAGVIDGDGNVRTKRPKYPQCAIRITSGKPQTDLRNSIIEILGCRAWMTKRHRICLFKNRIIKGRFYDLEFVISSKNSEFIKLNVLPNIKLTRKSEPLREFIFANYLHF